METESLAGVSLLVIKVNVSISLLSLESSAGVGALKHELAVGSAHWVLELLMWVGPLGIELIGRGRLTGRGHCWRGGVGSLDIGYKGG